MEERKSDPRAAASLALPWRMLVAPISAWRELPERGRPLPALLAQWLLLLVYGISASRPLADLWAAAGLAGSGGESSGHWLGLLLLYLPLNLALAAGAALLIRLALLLLGLRLSFGQTLSWLAYGLLPIYLGRGLGFLGFSIVQPLANNVRDAWALMFNPFSVGISGLFPRLSYAWVLASALDIFALWSIVLLLLGARHFLRLEWGRSAWALLALMLLWLAALTVVWRGMLAAPV